MCSELLAPIEYIHPQQRSKQQQHTYHHPSRGMVRVIAEIRPSLEELEYAESERRLQTIVESARKVICDGQIAVIVMIPHIVHWVSEQHHQTLSRDASDVTIIAEALEPKLGGPNSELVAEHVIRASTRAQLGIQNRNSIELRASSAKQYKADLDCYFDDPDLHAIIALLTPLKDQQKIMGYEEAQLSSIRYHVGILNSPQSHKQPSSDMIRHHTGHSASQNSHHAHPHGLQNHHHHAHHHHALSKHNSQLHNVTYHPDGPLQIDNSTHKDPQNKLSRIQQPPRDGHTNESNYMTPYSHQDVPTSSYPQMHRSSGSHVMVDGHISPSPPSNSPTLQSPRSPSMMHSPSAPDSNGSTQPFAFQNHSMHDFIPTMNCRELEYFYAMLPGTANGTYTHHELELARSQSISEQELQATDPDDLDPHQRMRLNQQRSLSPVLPRRPRDLAEVQAEIERSRLLAQNLVESQHAATSKKNGDIRCLECGTDTSPEWRKGPNGPKTLCNRCGLRFAKKLRMQK